MQKVIYVVLFLCFASNCLAVQFQDPLKDYKGAIKKQDADAQPGMIYRAWGNNMANRIESGEAQGVVIDKNGVIHGTTTATATGAGNIVIQGSKVNGPIINMSTNRNINAIANGK